MSGRGNPSSDRQVSDLRPPMTTNESAPDPTAGERSCPQHPHWSGMSYDCAFCRATPDADDASEPLTEAERTYGRTDPSLQWRGRWYSEASVERIKAAAATKARAEALREAAREVPFAPAQSARVHRWLMDRADRIARGGDA